MADARSGEGLPSLRAVSFHTPAADLRGAYVVTYDDGEQALIDIADDHALAYSNRLHWPRRYKLLRRRSELGDVAIAARNGRPRSVFALPEGRVLARWSGWFLAELASIAALGVALTMYAHYEDPDVPVLMMLFGTLVGVFIAFFALPQARHAYEVDGVAHDLRGLVRPDQDERAGLSLAEDVKTEYGRLLSDVVYRIENAALFDPSVPTTREFAELMVRWDEDRARLRPDQRQTLAADLRVAFDTARAHAERVGLTHLPATARKPAAVAAKSLLLARNPATTEAERRTALAKANEILDSLMLYYLPTPGEATELLEGRRPKALPWRRSGTGA
ncbi:hypothetical protein [Tessaracoccus oleiagri]|uniref:Uncharacterized protein n=1 Tax=Tessaracoccus oleiagri TaxID=686624 RepID=A0A1G9KSX7_9ACTN|nr:hypothetical protein [Tessaracoccus oleiagri]SDL52385.1 hypothetical protein SAMN04488242_1796 [Tessaracoccus oleiagri]